MYPALLFLHSLMRWLVVSSLILAVFFSYKGWLKKKQFSRLDNAIRHWTASLAHLQFLIGLGLYGVSPFIQYFLHQYKEAVHLNVSRFFGMEHSVMMISAITIITIGSFKAKRKQTDIAKFRTMAIWFSIALLIILTMIPWPFSPLVSRPYFRGF